MNLRLSLLNLSLRLVEKPFLTRVTDPERLRARFERSARLWFRPPRGTKRAWEKRGGLDLLTVCGPGVADAGPTLFYVHGGGFVFGSPRTHSGMLARLSELSGLRACLPEYRRAPEHQFPAALEDVLQAYQSCSGPVILGGDSAGGALALALLSEICTRGLAMPTACFVFSPLTDMTFSGPSFGAHARADVVLPAQRAQDMAALYLGEQDRRDPRVSPIFADFTGACPVWISVGQQEILFDDSSRLAARLTDQGVSVTLVTKDKLPHVWPLFHNLLPEADRTLRELSAWIRQQLRN